MEWTMRMWGDTDVVAPRIMLPNDRMLLDRLRMAAESAVDEVLLNYYPSAKQFITSDVWSIRAIERLVRRGAFPLLMGISIVLFPSQEGAAAREAVTAGEPAVLLPQNDFRLAVASTGDDAATLAFGRSAQALVTSVEPAAVSSGSGHPTNAPTSATAETATTFDVRSYAGEPVTVGVVHGRVAVSKADNPKAAPLATLGTGDIVTLDNGRSQVTHNADLGALTAWTQGRLVFNATPLRDVVRDVARTFNIVITVMDPALLDKPITASADEHTIAAVVDAIAKGLGATCRHTGNQLIIDRPSTNPSNH